MTKALTRTGQGSGVVPAVCSALVPGVGQLVNGDTDKAIGVFVVAGISGLSFLGAIPLLGTLAGAVYGVTWLYGVGDAFVRGRKRG
jgi:TM2 domain-containing membrane protein YozV